MSTGGRTVAEQSAGRQPSSSNSLTLTRIIDLVLNNIVWVLLVVFTIGASFFNPAFATIANLQNILVQATVLGFVALAVALALLISEIDLSVVGVMAFSATVGAWLMVEQGLPTGIAILAILAVGLLIGLFNGFCVAKLRMTALVETLAMGLLLGGAVLAITQGRTISGFPDAFAYMGLGTIGTWPVMPVALVLVYVLAYLALNRTRWGRRLYAVGGNPAAAFGSGINVSRVRLHTFAAAGLLSGCAGFLIASYLGGVNSTMGSNLLLYAVAAPVIGGVSLFGGRGTVLGMLGGVLLLTVIQVGLQIIGIPAFYVQMVGGAMILFAVFIDAVRVRRQLG